MSKFNQKSTGTKTLNHENAPAYSMSPEYELAAIALTSFVEDKYYESASDENKRVEQLAAQVDKDFLGKLAVFARKEYHMRSITHVLAGELAKLHKGQRKYLEAVIQRPDDMNEIVAYYGHKYGKPIPNALKKAVRAKLGSFDEYKLAKYRCENKSVKLVDLFNLTHPKAKSPKQAETWKKLMAGNLKNTKTWESKLSETGKKVEDEDQKAKNKKDAWTEMVKGGNLGYMALLRNLRNLIENVPELIPEVCKMLVNPEKIRNSKQLPFRFYSAYREIAKVGSPQVSMVMDALAQALDISCQNIPELKGVTVVAIDNSHSMTHNPLSGRGSVTRADVACLLGAMMHKRAENTITSVFADDMKITNLMKTNSVLANMDRLMRTDVGCGGNTNGYKVPEWAAKEKIHVDNFIVFTDLQMYDAEGVTYHRTPPDYGRSFKEEINNYRRVVNPKAKVFSFDCAGYGTMQLPAGDSQSYLIPGFSEKAFDFIKFAQEDRDALIKRIKEYKI